MIKDGTSKEERQYIAGLLQSQQASVAQQTIHERARHLADYFNAKKAAGEQPVYKEGVRQMFVKGGFTQSAETVVCAVFYHYVIQYLFQEKLVFEWFGIHGRKCDQAVCLPFLSFISLCGWLSDSILQRINKSLFRNMQFSQTKLLFS